MHFLLRKATPARILYGLLTVVLVPQFLRIVQAQPPRTIPPPLSVQAAESFQAKPDQVRFRLPPLKTSLLGAVIAADDDGNPQVVESLVPKEVFRFDSRPSTSLYEQTLLFADSNRFRCLVTTDEPIESPVRVTISVDDVRTSTAIPTDPNALKRILLASQQVREALRAEKPLFLVRKVSIGVPEITLEFGGFLAGPLMSTASTWKLTRPHHARELYTLKAERPVEFAYVADRLEFTGPNAATGDPSGVEFHESTVGEGPVSTWAPEHTVVMKSFDRPVKVNVFFAGDRESPEFRTVTGTKEALPPPFWPYVGEFFLVQWIWILVAAAVVVLAHIVMIWRKASLPLHLLLLAAFTAVLALSANYYAKREQDRQVHIPTHGSSASDELVYGTCEVSIPKNHRKGEIELPDEIFVVPIERESADRHFVVQPAQTKDRQMFLDDLKQSAGTGEAFVFLHGYNNDFNEAVRRTAQLFYDMEFPGAPILYRWPSTGTIRGYASDEESAVLSTPKFKRLVAMLNADSGLTKIHLVAHSMGNRILVGALKELSAEGLLEGDACRIDHVVLNAPDVNARDFVDNIAPKILGRKPRFTLYASKNDGPLKLSYEVHQYRRLGDPTGGIVSMAGMESIDVSFLETDGHTHDYFAAIRTVVSDIHQLIVQGISPPEKRFGIEKFSDPLHWRFLP